MTIDGIGNVLRLLRTMQLFGLMPLYIVVLDDRVCEVWLVHGKSYYVYIEEEERPLSF